VHKPVHTKTKKHSSAFWAELSKHVRNWRTLDKRMAEMKM
jgi:predicted metal-dependent hydrolase